MPTVYMHLKSENHAYVQAEAIRGRTTQAFVVDAIISEARRLGWQVAGQEAQVVRALAPHDGPASGAADQLAPPAGRGPGPTDDR